MRIGLVLIALFLTPSVSSALCVKNEYANLRRAPTTKSEMTWRVFRFMPLKKLSQNKNWLQVLDFEGKMHWVRQDLVSSSMKCAVIKNEYANLRQGPGTKFPLAKAKKGLKYLSFEVLEEKNSWVRLKDAEGDIVWIYRPLLWMSQDSVPIQP